MAPGATLGDLSCNTNEIAKYDGTNSIWVCAADEDTDTNTDTLADLPSCLDGDVAKYDGVNEVWFCDSSASSALSPPIVVDSTGALVGLVNGEGDGLEDARIQFRLDDGRLVTGLRVSKRTPNEMPHGVELWSTSLNCGGPYCVERGVKPAIFLPFVTVGPGDMLYITDDMSGAGQVPTLSKWNSELNVCTNVPQLGSACAFVDPVMQLDFVPPFHIE